MELFTLHSITSELATLLAGHRLGKVVQLGVTDLAFDFRLRDGRWLFVSTDPQRLAIHLTTRSIRQSENEARTDTPFVALCKKYLSGARVTSIECLGYDRVVRFSLVTEYEMNKEIARDLVIHLTGRSANVFVLEDNRILAELRERQGNKTNEPYQDPSPPIDKIDPFYCSPDHLNDLIAVSENDPAIAARVHLIGFGPQFAAEFAARAKQGERPHVALQQILDEVFAHPPAPSVYSSAPLDEMKRAIGRESFTISYAPSKMEHLRNLHFNPLDSVNQAADACFALQELRRFFLSKRQQAESQLTSRLKRLQSLQKNLTRENEGFAKAETHQRFGELLLANLHQAEKHNHAFRVVDFYDAEQKQISIPAANQATAQEAAEHYFKLARKARNGMQTIAARLPEIESQITKLNSQIERLRSVQQSEELANLLIEIGVSEPRTERKSSTQQIQKKPEKISGVRRYRSSDGYEILVGRTSRDNDHLTLRIAKSFDLWFHAADYPGSHVVLRNPKRGIVPMRAILEAAQLAAKFSQANNDSGAKVAVNYCEKKFVSKPKGFNPGQVRLSSFKTMMVEPVEAGERIL